MADQQRRLADNQEQQERVWGADELHRHYATVHPGLLRYLRVVAGQSAEDVASQVWLEIASSPDIPPDDEGMRRLAFVIARRRASDMRRRWWQRKVDVRPPGSADLERAAPDIDAPRDTTVRLLRLLPRAQAEVVLLRVVGDLSVDDVAAIVGRNPGAVRALQHRALQRLARELSDAP